MHHVRFGSTGLRVSRLCLGTMTFGVQCNEEESTEILDRAFDLGITFLDTADAYPLGGDAAVLGMTEEILGRWLRGRRHAGVVATKANAPRSRRPWDRGNSRKHLVEACEASRRRLGTDWIDLDQLHGPDPSTPMEETLRALDDLVTAGKVRYVGVSNWPAWMLARSLGVSELHDWSSFVSVQPRYNLLYRQIEHELLPLCESEGLAVIPYNPLAGGLLSGKHSHADGPGENTRFAITGAGERYQERYWQLAEFAAIDALRPVAEEAGMSLVTLAVAWMLAQPAVTAPIIGVSRPEHLDDNVAALDARLGEGMLAHLDELTHDFRLTEPVVWGKT